MKISILTAGTRGDVQPFIALGIELKKLGAEVTIVSSVSFETLIKSYGLEYKKLRIDISKIMESGEIDLINNKGLSINDKNFLSRAMEMQEDFYNACTDTDVIIYHFGAAIGHMIAKEKGIISILASPIPVLKTKEYPSILFYQKRFPKVLNRLTHTFFNKFFWNAVKKPIELFYKEKLNKDALIINPLESDDLKLISCSQSIFKTPEPGFASGYWYLDKSDNYSPPKELEAFLRKGEKPIYVGFGSIGKNGTTGENTNKIITAIQKTKSRAIISTGYGGISSVSEFNDNIFVLKDVPHSWLFPKVSMAIHHGGAGTTAEAFRAGIPMIIIPHSNDQYAWGKRVFELGVGANQINIRNLTVEKLINAIEYAKQKAIVENAKRLSMVIRNENGARDTARFVVNYLKLRSYWKDKDMEAI